MTETEAEKIITEYVFSDYKLEALYPIVDEKFPDADERDKSCMQRLSLMTRFKRLLLL